MIGQNYLCVYTQKAIWKNENFNQSCTVKVKSLSRVRLFMIPQTVAYQAPSIHGIFQARVLESVAMSFSRGNSRPRGRTRVYPHCRQTLYCLSHRGSLSHLLLLLLSRFSLVRLFATPQTEANQAPLSLVFSRQEHWSGLTFPSPMHKSET